MNHVGRIVVWVAVVVLLGAVLTATCNGQCSSGACGGYVGPLSRGGIIVPNGGSGVVYGPLGAPRVVIQSPPQVPRQNPPACIVQVVATYNGQQSIGSGTMIHVAGRILILTCAHGLEGDVVAIGSTGQWPCRVIAKDTPADIALLDGAIAPGNAYRLANADPQPGSAGVLCGFPGGAYRSVRCTIVAIGRVRESSGVPVMEVLPTCESGDSGGPIFDPAGNVCGVIWGRSDSLGTAATPVSVVLSVFREHLSERLPYSAPHVELENADSGVAARIEALISRIDSLETRIDSGDFRGEAGPAGPQGPRGEAGPAGRVDSAALVPVVRAEVASQLASLPAPYKPDYDAIAGEVLKRLPPITFRRYVKNQDGSYTHAGDDQVPLGGGYDFVGHPLERH